MRWPPCEPRDRFLCCELWVEGGRGRKELGRKDLGKEAHRGDLASLVITVMANTGDPVGYKALE